MKRPALRELARRAGIFARYRRADQRIQVTSDDTRAVLLEAMGWDASSEAAVGRALRSWDERERGELLDPVRVVTEGSSAGAALPLRLPPQTACELELQLEDGTKRHASTRTAASAQPPWAWAPLPWGDALAPGYHTLSARARAPGRSIEGRQHFIVTPARCLDANRTLGSGRVFGLLAQLYSVRSETNWGIGDLGDLRQLVRWSAREGCQFVGVNPLHAMGPASSEHSPYYPSSRLYPDPLYLEIERVPELAHCQPAQQLLQSDAHRQALRALRSGDRVDYAGVRRLKLEVLALLHETFRTGHRHGDPRRAAYARFMERERAWLRPIAALWARELRPSFLSADEDLLCYVQFELDRQLGDAARSARERSMAVGLYGDLALGSGADSADVRAFGSWFATGAHLGAPPDAYASQGQDWGLCPLLPEQLRRDGYAYFRALLERNMRHFGALRMDHVMALWRQFWIPRGEPASSGTYVRYPAHELAGILALESVRQGCLVIGEDLGTVPRQVRREMRSRGLLRCQVLYFERRDEDYRHPRHYCRDALVTVNTHDLATLRGFWEARDLRARHARGLLDDDAFERALRERASDKAHLLAALREARLLEARSGSVGFDELCPAVHAFLAKTPSLLFGIMVDDVAGEPEAVNVPGTPSAQNWTRRLGPTLPELQDDPAVARVFAAIRRHRPQEA